MPYPMMTVVKFLDQPKFADAVAKNVKWALPATGAAVTAYETYKAPEGKKKETFVKYGSVMGMTIAGAMVAEPFFEWAKNNISLIGKYTKAEGEEQAHNVVEGAKNLIDDLRKKLGEQPSAHSKARKAFDELKGLLGEEVVGQRHLKLGEMRQVSDRLDEIAGILQPEKRKEFVKNFLNMLVPEPKAAGQEKGGEEFISEIWELTFMGLTPVLGGILGGALGNAINRANWRAELKDQSKEGLYQFLANIVLCNVGAFFAIKGLETFFPSMQHKRNPRIIAMTSGILAVGVIGGSTIANFFGKNFFNPLFEQGVKGAMQDLRTRVREEGWGTLFRDLNSERHPEAADVGLHVDDFATVGVLSGLAWVKPILPFLYSFSGHRAGQGYRNGKTEQPAHAKSEGKPHIETNDALETLARNGYQFTPFPTGKPQGFTLSPPAFSLEQEVMQAPTHLEPAPAPTMAAAVQAWEMNPWAAMQPTTGSATANQLMSGNSGFYPLSGNAFNAYGQPLQPVMPMQPVVAGAQPAVQARAYS